METLAPLRGRVVIDEVQLAPRLFSSLRVLADRPTQPARFLLLGSASPRLIRHAAETLAGRVHYIRMSGFHGSEVGIEHQRRLWLQGGFPQAFRAPEPESLKWRQDFIHTFIERDLPMLVDSRPAPQRLHRLLQLLAHRHGHPTNASQLGREMGVTFKTVQSYQDLLVGAFILRELPPYAANVSKRLRKAPRLYFRDTGLLHALLQIGGWEQLQNYDRRGFSWEGFCLEHLLHLSPFDPDRCFYYSVQGGAEIDLVIDYGGQVIGFEFKHADLPRMTRSMAEAADDIGAHRVFIVHPGTESFELGGEERFRALAWRDISRLPEWLP